jgi:hypothetical protein
MPKKILKRVKRLSDGKIFSSPRGAAMHYGLPITNEIIACANGYLRTSQGCGWEWVEEDAPVFPKNPDRPEYIKKIARKKHLKHRSNRAYVRFLLPAFIEYAMKHDTREPALLSDVVPILENIVRESRGFEYTTDTKGLSKHIATWGWLYEILIGMKVTKMYSELSRRESLAISIDLKNDIADINDPDHPEASNVDARIHNHANLPNTAKPVVRMNDGKTFKSIREASLFCNIHEAKIAACCEGDIEYVTTPLSDAKFVFKYARR